MRGCKKTKINKCGDSISWDKSQTYGQKLKYHSEKKKKKRQKLKYLANFCKSFVKIYYIINSIIYQHLHITPHVLTKKIGVPIII